MKTRAYNTNFQQSLKEKKFLSVLFSRGCQLRAVYNFRAFNVDDLNCLYWSYFLLRQLLRYIITFNKANVKLTAPVTTQQ